jgi:hypothetical protein
MVYRNEKSEGRFPKERVRHGREKHLCDIMRYWGFHQAAANIDFFRERVDVEEAITSWSNFPKCLDEYPTVITKKMKLDPKEEQLLA